MDDDRIPPSFVTEQPDGSLEVALARPIAIAGTQVTALRLREPSVEDQLAADGAGRTDAQREVTLLANLAEIDPAELRAVKLRDYRRLQDALSFFLA